MSRTAGPPNRLLLASALVLAGGATRAGVPEWARPYVDAGLPSNASTPARVLFSEEQVAVQLDGTLLVRRRLAAQALTSEAADLALGYFPFDDRTEILRSKAWHLPPGGRARASSSGAIDLAVDGLFLSDARVRFLHVDGIERGSLVFFEFEARDRPHVLVRDVVFGQAAPIDFARFELVLPRGWSAHYAWLRRAPLEPRVVGESWSWEVRGVPAPSEEPMGEAPFEVVPRLVVAIVPPTGEAVDAVVLPDWSAFGNWYERLASGRAAVTPAIEAALRSALGGVPDGELSQASALARFTRDRVRYVAKEIGIGGYRPRPAATGRGRLEPDVGRLQGQGNVASRVARRGGPGLVPDARERHRERHGVPGDPEPRRFRPLRGGRVDPRRGGDPGGPHRRGG